MKTKPFDLEAAKNGAKVVTRDGRPVRIICWDSKGEQPIVALVCNVDEDVEEFVSEYGENGYYWQSGRESKYDLFLVDEFEESEDERMVRIIENVICTNEGEVIAQKYGLKLTDLADWLEKQNEHKPTPVWMPKFLDELRSKKNYFDWDEHRDIEGHILAIINWIAPDYFDRKDKGQKPAEWSEKHIADVFEKVGLAKIVREQGNNELTNALQDAMLELSKVENAECSEEDEANMKRIIRVLEDNESDWRELSDWLKSLRHQSHWKPSDEQIRPLGYAIDYFKKKRNDTTYLESLYNDLKKLR